MPHIGALSVISVLYPYLTVAFPHGMTAKPLTDQGLNGGLQRLDLPPGPHKEKNYDRTDGGTLLFSHPRRTVPYLLKAVNATTASPDLNA